jgi:hypothetical protein
MEFRMNEALEILEQTPGVLDALLRHKSAAWLNARKTAEAFSPLDVMGHLMHAEMTDWIPRVRLILEHRDTRAFAPFDRFDFRGLIANKPIAELLEEFAALRRQSLRTLHNLHVSAEQLEWPGLHPELGRVSLGNLLATWAVHDLGHITQVVKTMAHEYADAVGPWRAFLSVVQ